MQYIWLSLPFYVIEDGLAESHFGFAYSTEKISIWLGKRFYKEVTTVSKTTSCNFTLDLKKDEDSVYFPELIRKLFHISTPQLEIMYLHLIRFALGIL